METKANPYDLHVLVCTNTRANIEKKSCGPLGAEEIRAELKEWLKAEVEKRKLTLTATTPPIKCRVNGSGCLDFCSKGIAIAIYPFGEFLLNVDKSNLGDIKANLTKRLDLIESERKTTHPSPADF
jgi:(2Fe-2S) ferredoxin